MLKHKFLVAVVIIAINSQLSHQVADIAFDAICNFKGECLNICGRSSFESRWNSPCTAAFFAEVEVDTGTGEVRVLKIISVLDSGIAINPMTGGGRNRFWFEVSNFVIAFCTNRGSSFI